MWPATRTTAGRSRPGRAARRSCRTWWDSRSRCTTGASTCRCSSPRTWSATSSASSRRPGFSRATPRPSGSRRQRSKPMQVSAILRHARISPQKCRLVADLVRGQPVGDALAVLAYTPKKGAKIVRKVLESAIANAEHNHEADIDELKVARIEVDAAPVAKRFHARAKGRGNRIVKRLSHIRVTVADRAR